MRIACSHIASRIALGDGVRSLRSNGPAPSLLLGTRAVDLVHSPILATTWLTIVIVQQALENVTSRETARSSSAPTPVPTRTRTESLKRKKPELPTEDEPNPDGLPYNTRHKGQKRVRVTGEPIPRQTPARKPRATRNDTSESISALAVPSSPEAPVKRGRGRPRKSAASAVPTGSQSASVPSTSPVKRGRGRPRKSAPEAQPPVKSAGSPSKKREVFYGVVVTQRARQYTEDDDADGEIDDSEDHVVILQSGETSSLGSSNKGMLAPTAII